MLALCVWMFGCRSNNPEAMSPEEREQWFALARKRMVREQLQGPGRNIRNPRVLAAMAKVPRHRFVPKEYWDEAYEDHPLPIGYGQTISQPFIVAFMTEAIDPQPDDKVLEIGTGSGYQAAILAELVKEVYTIEIVPELGRRAQRTLEELGYTNVHVRIGDGYRGWPEAAPFDAILLTCAPDHVPPPLTQQLKEGGRMILPVTGTFGMQELILLLKKDGKLYERAVLPVRFVPMVGEAEKPSLSHSDESLPLNAIDYLPFHGVGFSS